MDPTRLTPTLVVAGGLLAVQTLSGCTSKGCTDIGARSHVGVTDGKAVVPVTHVMTHPRKYQPNGPSCEPTVYVAAVTAGVSGVVETDPTG